MRLYDTDTGTYELIIFADESNQDSAPVFHNLPGESPFYTKDLFTQHPGKPGLYKYYGRKDDILVLANGEKVNPIPLEQAVQADPALKGVLLTGNGRAQTALIIEPNDDHDEGGRAKLLQKLWPRIEEANSHIPGPGRIARNMVICATPDKPFTRTGKGTVIRKLTQDNYQQEIDRLYNTSSQAERLVTIDLKPRQSENKCKNA
jgi:long-subunit acyl-CoA synthetase (AMP-forming)